MSRFHTGRAWQKLPVSPCAVFRYFVSAALKLPEILKELRTQELHVGKQTYWPVVALVLLGCDQAGTVALGSPDESVPSFVYTVESGVFNYRINGYPFHSDYVFDFSIFSDHVFLLEFPDDHVSIKIQSILSPDVVTIYETQSSNIGSFNVLISTNYTLYAVIDQQVISFDESLTVSEVVLRGTIIDFKAVGNSLFVISERDKELVFSELVGGDLVAESKIPELCLPIINDIGYQCSTIEKFLLHRLDSTLLQRNLKLVDLGFGNKHGRLAWSVSYLLSGLHVLYESNDPNFLRYEHYYLAAKQYLETCILNYYECMRTSRYSVDGSYQVFLLHYSRIASRYLGYANTASDVVESVRITASQILNRDETGFIEILSDDPNGYYPYPTLYFRKFSSFWADGVNVPINFLSDFLILLARIDIDADLLRDSLHFQTRFYQDDMWGYWNYYGQDGWTIDDDLSSNTPSYDGGGMDYPAHISYRQTDALALLLTCQQDCDDIVARLTVLTQNKSLSINAKYHLCKLHSLCTGPDMEFIKRLRIQKNNFEKFAMALYLSSHAAN